MRGDIKLYRPSEDQISIRALTAISASINAGEPTVSSDASGSSTGVVKEGATHDPTTASAHRFTGIAKSDSSDTAAAAGYVDLWVPFADTIYSASALTTAEASTQAKIDALKFKRVYLDLTATKWTVDSSVADAVTHAVVIIGGDYAKSTFQFLITPLASIIGHYPSA